MEYLQTMDVPAEIDLAAYMALVRRIEAAHEGFMTGFYDTIRQRQACRESDLARLELIRGTMRPSGCTSPHLRGCEKGKSSSSEGEWLSDDLVNDFCEC